ncbi:MAG: hypothetical protein Q8R82_05765 [Hyphomonadaceae bacterium]|nr:hypothetical protein [Hyphomonadaceae bacterium]
MFAGHYAAALAAKAIEPKAPTWALVAGCQLIDIGWSALVIAGIEHGRVDPSLPGSALVLEHMPYTHSLPGVIAWSLGAVLIARYALRLGWRPAIAIGAVVFSHWLLDLAVHRPDLELYPNGPKAGFALWDYPVIEQAVEIGLIAVAGMFWAAQRTVAGFKAWPAAMFVLTLVAVQIIAMLMPAVASSSIAETGPMALAVYLALTAGAAFLDRRANSPQPIA